MSSSEKIVSWVGVQARIDGASGVRGEASEERARDGGGAEGYRRYVFVVRSW